MTPNRPSDKFSTAQVLQNDRYCVTWLTRYTPRDKSNEVGVRDSCREKTVDGKEKAVERTAYIIDPGVNARIRVD